MSIFAYVGLPGSGKSYSVVEQQILPALKAGRLVVTNLPLKRDLICQNLGIEPAQLRDFPAEAVQADPELIMEAAPPGALLVLDEVWRLFPAGLKSNQVPEPFRAVFAEHRHRVNEKGETSQIVLVTQDLAQIAAFARQLVEQTFRTSKLTTLGMNSRFRTDIYAGSVSGPNPNPQSAIRQVFGRYEKSVYQYYTSHTQSQAVDGAAPDERAVDRRGIIWLRPVFIIVPILVVVAVVWALHYLMARRDELKHPVLAQGLSGEAGGRTALTFSPSGSPPVAPYQPSGQGSAPVAVWHVAMVVEGAPPLGGYAVNMRGPEREWVDLGQCHRDHFFWVCPHVGGWLDEHGKSDYQDPHAVRTYSSAWVGVH